jgi:biopolymer transport protein ExbD
MKRLLLVLIIFLLPAVSFAGDEEIKLLIPEYTIHEPSSKWIYRNLKDEDEKVKQTYKETDLDAFVSIFERDGYKVDQIEVWVDGVAAVNGVTKLLISLEGRGGIKITLKPKPGR